MNDSELLSAYLDGELSPGQVAGVEERLAAEPRFRREHRRLQEVAALVRVRCEPDPGFVVRHRERREARSPVLQWTWRELGTRLAAVAAALLIAAGVTVWQAGRPEAAPALETVDLLELEGQILGEAIPAAAEFRALAETDPAEEPVLLIALGGFVPTGGR